MKNLNYDTAHKLFFWYIFLEIAGFLLVLFGAVMFAVPTEEINFFEFWIKGIDVAPALVGFAGVVIWKLGSLSRHSLLDRVDLMNIEINREQEERRQVGKDREPEFIDKLQKAKSFYALHTRLAKAVFVVILVLITLMVVATFAGAYWNYFNEGGETTYILGGIGVFCILGLIRHIMERPRSG